MKIIIALTKEDLNKIVTDYLSNNDMCSPAEIKVDAVSKSISAIFSPVDVQKGLTLRRLLLQGSCILGLSIEDILSDALPGLDGLDIESLQQASDGGIEVVLVPKPR